MKLKKYTIPTLVLALFLIVALIMSLLLWRVFDFGKNKDHTSRNESLQRTDEEYITIKEWGIRFKAPQSFQGAEYFRPESTTGDSLTFTTPELAASSYMCRQVSGNIVLGVLTRSTQPDAQWGEVLAKVGDYHFSYRGPQAACSNNAALEGRLIRDLRGALTAIEAIP